MFNKLNVNKIGSTKDLRTKKHILISSCRLNSYELGQRMNYPGENNMYLQKRKLIERSYFSPQKKFI